jgi:hypothetical protein
MKKLLLAIAAVGTLGAALPAAAAPWDRPGAGGYGEIDQRIRDIQVRIDRGAHDGSLTVRETRGLRAQLDDIQRLEVRYGRDGLNRFERSDLNGRLDRLSNQVRGQRHDDDRRGHRW